MTSQVTLVFEQHHSYELNCKRFILMLTSNSIIGYNYLFGCQRLSIMFTLLYKHYINIQLQEDNSNVVVSADILTADKEF